MPVTEFQREVLSVILPNRNEQSHFAGGLVLNAADDSARFSHDFDIFHEADVEVAKASDLDVLTLQDAGYLVEHLSKEWTAPTTFRKARVSKKGQSVEIDWAADSVMRFFPVEKDELLGFRLHLFDMAVNKALALAARSVTRDYIDIIELDKRFPLEAICWAACGKDPGYSPLRLIGMMRRFARVDPTQLHKLTALRLDPIDLKEQWMAISIRAEDAFQRMGDTRNDLPIGIAFLNADGVPKWVESEEGLVQHPPSLRGCLPQISKAE